MKLVYGELALGLFALLASQFVDSPYGKLAASSKLPGLSLSPRLGWLLMELPATLSFGYSWYRVVFLRKAKVPLLAPLFATLFAIHYLNRGWFFPLSIRSNGKKASFSMWVILTGVGFTTVHGYLNATWFSTLATHLNDPDWTRDPRFVIGFFTYALSLAGLLHSEWVMRNLRTGAPNEPRYKIPYGGAYEFVTSPCYLFELTCWLGWFLMTWNPAGLGVFVVSFGNLFPRAFTQHRWYLEKFGDEYAHLQRKAIVPGLL